MRDKVPDVLIERLRLGELPPEKEEELRRRPDTAERIANVEASDRRILEQYPAAEMARAISAKLAETESAEADVAAPKKRVSPLRWFVAGPRGAVPLLAAALLIVGIGLIPVLLVTTGKETPLSSTSSENVRIKGISPLLKIYRESGHNVELLRDGTIAKMGDLLQIGYVAAGAQYGTIFSIDGGGTITLHYPETLSVVPRLQNGGEVHLPFSYKLDNAPSFERFFFVTSDAPFAVTVVLEAERKAESVGGPNSVPSLSGDFKVMTLTLKKGA